MRLIGSEREEREEREGGLIMKKSIKKHKTGSNKSQISCLMIFSWTYNESFNNKIERVGLFML